ncbi:MAG: radical SAM protein [Deltaproteobacteria bacterium]|nr:radical SAM protein [Deltaproteobacteria bacterium]
MHSALDILFVNPFSENEFGIVQAAHRPEFNLGTGYLAAYCIQEGFRVDVVDMGAEKVSTAGLCSIIKEKRPPVVGISIVTLLMDVSVKIAEAIKAIDEETLIVVGGPHPSALPERTLQDGPFDVVVCGEGEGTCVQLLKRFFAKESFRGLRGIAYREGEEIVLEGPAERIDDLDTLPIPYRKPETVHLYKNMVYFDEPDAAMYNLITTRGCPYKCTFCGQSVVFPRKVRRLSAEKVFDEMQRAFRKWGIRHFFFEDSTFVFSRKLVEDLCRLILKEGLRIKWGCTGRLDLVDREFYDLMKRAGCVFLFFGVESGNDEILRKIKKMFTVDEARKSVEIVRKLGIPFNTSFILGLPDDTKETVRQTIDFAKELNADYVTFSLATPYPGSEMYDTVTAQGWGVEKWSDYEQSRYNVPIYVPEEMTREELEALFHAAYREFYLRPGYMLGHLRKMKSARQLINHAKMGFSLLKGALRS